MSTKKQLALTVGSAAVKIGLLVGVGYAGLRFLEKQNELPAPSTEK